VPALSSLDLLRRLVAFDTTSRNSNLALADFVANYLDRPDVRIARVPSDDEQKTNLVVGIGPETDPGAREGLVLSGHMDVVPADETDWLSDPFALKVDDDRLIARGSCDMKGFLAVAVEALQGLDPAHLARPLYLLFTYDEEVGTLGAKQFVETRPNDLVLPRRVVIGEPTNFTAVRLHKGHLQLQLTIAGRAAHSGFPQSGDNAIEPMGLAITALAGLRQELEEETSEYSRYFGAVPFVTLNVAQIDGGSATNVVPDRCELNIGLRLMPGMESDAMVARVRERIARAIPGQGFDLVVINESPPMLLPEDNELYRIVCGEVGQTETASVYFATDAGWLSRAEFDCVIFGPGNMDTAHKPNEWIPAGDLTRGSAVLRQLVQRYCVE